MFKIDTRIRYSEVDGTGQLRLSALMNLFQDVGEFHTESAGYTLDRLIDEKIGWYVLCYDVKVNRLPHVGENVSLGTSASSFKGFLADRNHEIIDDDGNLIVIAHSYWTLMNLNTIRPIKVPVEMQEGYGIEAAREWDYCGRKLSVPENATVSYEFVVDRTKLDSNGHMNNAFYIEAAAAALPEGVNINRFQIEYRKQVVLGDRVIVKTAKEKDWYGIIMASESDEIYSIVNMYTEA